MIARVYRMLAARLDLPAEAVDRAIPGPDDGAVEAWLEAKLAPFPELTLERLRTGPVLAPGNQEVAFSDLVKDSVAAPVVAVGKTLDVDPQMVMWDPEQQSISEPQDIAASGAEVLHFDGNGNLTQIRTQAGVTPRPSSLKSCRAP